MRILFFCCLLLQMSAVATAQTTETKAGDHFVEVMPEYPGGIPAILRLFGKNIQYPDVPKRQAIQGKVYVRFVVDSTGAVRNPEVKQGLGGFYDQEALRLVGLLERFIPAKDNGRSVSSYFNVPVSFTEPQKRK